MSAMETAQQCTKPGCENERARGQRWCKGCRAEDKRVRRAGNSAGEHAGNGEQSAGNDVSVGVETPPVTGLNAAKVRIIALEAEVARLKRDLRTRGEELAEALRQLANVPVVDARGGGYQAEVNQGGMLSTRPAARKMGSCGHGQFCQALGCRAGR